MYKRQFHIRVQQKLLGVAHTRHLDVIDEREARDAFELMGQVVRADEKFFGDIIQRELLRVIAVDIAGDGVDLVGDGIVEFLGHIGVARAGLCDGTQEFHKFAVDGKLCQRRAGLLAQRDVYKRQGIGGKNMLDQKTLHAALKKVSAAMMHLENTGFEEKYPIGLRCV